jgi:integrase
MAPSPLKEIAMLMLDTGMRPRGGLVLEMGACTAYAGLWRENSGTWHVPGGEPKNTKRNLSLTVRVSAMLSARRKAHDGDSFMFPGESGGAFLVSSLGHQHTEFGTLLGMAGDFVIHSLRHTMLIRLGESGRTPSPS